MPKVNFIQKIHNSTKRDCLGRMVDEKVKCMKIARKFSKDFSRLYPTTLKVNKVLNLETLARLKLKKCLVELAVIH